MAVRPTPDLVKLFPNRPFLLLALAAGPILVQADDALRRGDALEAGRRHREALETYLEADRRTPGSSLLLRRIATQYDRLSVGAPKAEKAAFLQKALDAAERSVKADPADSQARLCLAVVCGRLAQRESPKRQIELSKRIKEEAEEAVRLDPRNDIAWHVLARWNYEMASVNSVLRGFAQVIYGKFPEASSVRAEECFQKAIAAGPPRVMHHVEYGLMLEALGRKIDARKQLETGLSLPAKDQEDEETQQRARQALDRLR
jgi:tetratricopeptide (TPR) repeat protein